MNDKQQLAAMGEHLSDQQPMCLAKRVEELEAQARVMAGLLREVIVRDDFDRDDGDSAGRLLYRIDAALTGKLPAPVAPEGWQMVPVEPTPEMLDEGLNRLNTWGFNTPECIYNAMLSAAPAPEAK